MPTYQYRCQDCGQDLEIFQKFTDASLTVCPECEGSLRKVFNAVGVVFKGSGFYKTDSRSGSSSGASSQNGSESSKSASSTSTSKNGSESASTSSSSSNSTSSPTSKAAAS